MKREQKNKAREKYKYKEKRTCMNFPNKERKPLSTKIISILITGYVFLDIILRIKNMTDIFTTFEY